MATLVRWDPFREVAALHNEMNRMLGLARGENGAALAGDRTWAPALDVWETDSEVVYAFDLPGVPEDRISVEVEDDVLTVQATRERSEEVSDEKLHRVERRFGSFTRTIGLPQGVDESGVKAKYEHGVLEVHVPKPEQPKPRRIQIGIGDTPAAVEGTATESA